MDRIDYLIRNSKKRLGETSPSKKQDDWRKAYANTLKVDIGLPTSDRIAAGTMRPKNISDSVAADASLKSAVNELSSCSAPVYNKGAYMPVFKKSDALYIGRK